LTHIDREHVRDAVEGHASRFVVGFVFGADQENLDIASGIAVCWKGKRIIVTASHVLQGPRLSETRIILPTDRPFERAGRALPAEATAVGRTTEALMPTDVKVVRSRELDDLCYFEVDSEFGSNSDLQFHNLGRVAKTPRPGTICLMLGYPRDMARVLSHTEADVHMTGRWSDRVTLGKDSRFLKWFRPQKHFLMRFQETDKGTSAVGFSGAGIWFPTVHPQNQIVWRPDLGLAGIQSRWYASRRLTQVVKVERLINLLSKQSLRAQPWNA
jgi:hypothetical protein